jgi:hypothetical protein
MERSHSKLLCCGTSAENCNHNVQTYNLNRATPPGWIKMHVINKGQEREDDVLLRTIKGLFKYNNETSDISCWSTH